MNVPQRIGYRGSDLLLWAVVWTVVGWNVLNGGDTEPEHRVPLEVFPLEVRAAVWFGAALVAVWAACRRPPDDSLGFLALVIPAALRALSYTACWLLGVFHVDSGLAWGGAWVSALTWTAITLIVVRQAGRPELPQGVEWTRVKP